MEKTVLIYLLPAGDKPKNEHTFSPNPQKFPYEVPLPETNRAENGWLEYDPFLLGNGFGLFSGDTPPKVFHGTQKQCFPKGSKRNLLV